MPKIGLLFPGQGSQNMGMGQELVEHFPEAAAVYQQADKVLGMGLSRIILNGPEEELKPTNIAQPAILTASIAAWQVLRSRWEPQPGNCLAAGHSLGEYSALVAAQVLDFPTAVTLVKKRGEYMQQAAQLSGGGMAAVIGVDAEAARHLCQEADDGNVQVANLNCPGQIVISGTQAALEKAAALAKTKKIRVMPLAVSGPFHSRFMQPAAEHLAADLQSAGLHPPIFPVIANVTAEPVKADVEIKKMLIQQVSGAVRWEETMRYMLNAGVTLMIEIGPGKVLRGLMKKIAPEIRVLGAFSALEIEETVAALQGI